VALDVVGVFVGAASFAVAFDVILGVVGVVGTANAAVAFDVVGVLGTASAAVALDVIVGVGVATRVALGVIDLVGVGGGRVLVSHGFALPVRFFSLT
jgi:hypothetical protein